MALKPFSGFSKTIRDLAPSTSTKTERDIRIEEVIDIDKNLDLYTKKQLASLDPKILYQSGPLNFFTQVVNTTREVPVSCTRNDLVNLELFHTETIDKILKQGKSLAHIGLIAIGIKGLSRKGLETKTLVLVYDGCWTNDIQRGIIVGEEVDMNENGSLLYCAPNLLKSAKDLKKLKIGIQTKGYDSYEGDNIMLTISVLGRLTTSSNVNYKLNIDRIIQSLSSRGVKMINPMKIQGNTLARLEWDLSKHCEPHENILVPSKSMIYENSKGGYSMRFSDYITKAKNASIYLYYPSAINRILPWN